MLHSALVTISTLGPMCCFHVRRVCRVSPTNVAWVTHGMSCSKMLMLPKSGGRFLEGRTAMLMGGVDYK